MTNTIKMLLKCSFNLFLIVDNFLYNIYIMQNEKYYTALKAAIDKRHGEGRKANVLDIGTGTGLLSMMAAKCGADTITACEVKMSITCHPALKEERN